MHTGAAMLEVFTREELESFAKSVYRNAMGGKRADRLMLGRWLLAGAIKGLPAALEALRRTGQELDEAQHADVPTMIDKALTFLAQSVDKGSCQLDSLIETLRQRVAEQ